jgi:GAF domain-containing protein
MGWFSRDAAHEQEVLALLSTAGRLNQENERLRGEISELQELLRHQDQDLLLLLSAAQRFRRGAEFRELAQAMLDLCFRPLDLASFYVALVDWEADELRFPLYHEGGRNRNHPARRFSAQPGLTGRALQSGAPLYTRTLEEAEANGAILTEAEKGSGLIPSSWYGVPFGGPGQPLGLVSFQSFHTDAFPESRRRVIDALVSLFSLAL